MHQDAMHHWPVEEVCTSVVWDAVGECWADGCGQFWAAGGEAGQAGGGVNTPKMCPGAPTFPNMAGPIKRKLVCAMTRIWRPSRTNSSTPNVWP